MREKSVIFYYYSTNIVDAVVIITMYNVLCHFGYIISISYLGFLFLCH